MGDSGDGEATKELTGVMGAWWETGATCTVEMLRESLGFAERATLEGNILSVVFWFEKVGSISGCGTGLLALITGRNRSRRYESAELRLKAGGVICRFPCQKEASDFDYWV